MDERMDITLNRFRSRINSYPPGMCPLVLYRSILQMSLNQSCGKCVPCRDGLSEVDRLFGSVISGDATEETLVKMKDLCEMIASTADCAVGVVAATTVLDSLREFADEYESHVRDRRKVSEGETWMPFHFPDSPVNMITNAALDEFARIPEYKVCAVRVDKI